MAIDILADSKKFIFDIKKNFLVTISVPVRLLFFDLWSENGHFSEKE